MNKFVISLAVLLLAITACQSGSENKKATSSEPEIETIVLNDSIKRHLIIKGSSIAKQVAAVLQKNLKKAIKKDGFDHAVDFCHKRAGFITDSMSQVLNVKVKRVAKKYRNSFNETTPQESDIYKKYIIEWLEGEPVKPQIILNENGNPVFYGMIFINKKACLNCHGMVGKELPVERAEKIKKYYPNDKAVNFKKGEPRGMWAITFPEYKVVQK